MQDQQKQLVAKLKESQNVLVTVSKNPSVDQLSAAIGLTLALNKLDKHATAVFSGQVPSTIEFLKPEETLEKNTDSLRDFIIALDKSKADKLRYKVEDQVVRIFITPYRTSITEKDLDFSQGDFNVDVVVALGVPSQQDLDEAIEAHGRILHDATVAALSIEGQQELGTLNLLDSNASSLSEMVAGLVEEMDQKLVDPQIATALLTGIVATTNRFSNNRTTPKTMSVSSVLMAAGANQQLIANELETQTEQPAASQSSDSEPSETGDSTAPPKEPGMLEISHEETTVTPDAPAPEEPATDDDNQSQINVDEDGRLIINSKLENEPDQSSMIRDVHSDHEDDGQAEHDEPIVTRERMIEPPSRDSALTANTEEEGFDSPTEELTLPPTEMPLLEHDHASPIAEPVNTPEQETPSYDAPQPSAEVGVPDTPPQDETSQDDDTDTNYAQDEIDTETETLADIEKAVGSPHLSTEPATTEQPDPDMSLDDARSAVEAALNAAGSTAPPNPIAALNAQPLGPDLRGGAPEQPEPVYQPAPGFGSQPTYQPEHELLPGNSPGDQSLDMPIPKTPAGPPTSSFPGVMPSNQQQHDTLPPPPPVPPPPIFPS